MAKDKLTDYDATASNNTDIGGIDINQGTMIPSNVDNAIREIMSHLKDFAAGTQAVSSIAVSGDLTVDTSTLKVDSTNNQVGVGIASPVAPLHVKAATNVHIGIDDSSSDALIFAANDAYATAVVPLKFQANSFKFNGSSELVRIQSGGGISFNGDTATANALDDYEEGTWTASTSQGSVTTNGGTYVKIGKIVTIRANLSNFTNSSNTNSVEITGLPFTSASNNYGVGACMIRFVNTGGQEYVQTYLGASSATMFLFASDTSSNANWAAVSYSMANQDWDIIFTMSYIV